MKSQPKDFFAQFQPAPAQTQTCYGTLEQDRPMHPADREELFELYWELHLTSGRAAVALRLAGSWDAPEDEFLPCITARKSARPPSGSG